MKKFNTLICGAAVVSFLFLLLAAAPNVLDLNRLPAQDPQLTNYLVLLTKTNTGLSRLTPISALQSLIGGGGGSQVWTNDDSVPNIFIPALGTDLTPVTIGIPESQINSQIQSWWSPQATLFTSHTVNGVGFDQAIAVESSGDFAPYDSLRGIGVAVTGLSPVNDTNTQVVGVEANVGIFDRTNILHGNVTGFRVDAWGSRAALMNAIAFDVRSSPLTQAGGTVDGGITNVYGLHVANLYGNNNPAISHAWSIYTEGTPTNHFGGDVEIIGDITTISGGKASIVQGAFNGNASGLTNLNAGSYSNYTTAATARTMNTWAGKVKVSSGQQSYTVTDSLVSAGSAIIATVSSDDTTALNCKAIPGSGSFVLKLNATATADCSVSWWLVQP